MGRSQKKAGHHYVRVAAAYLLAAVSVAGCKKAEPAPEVVVTVQAAKPVVGPISEQITGDAILAPLAQASLSPKISAPVRKFYVQRGSHVTAVQLLVTLEHKDLAGTAVENSDTLTAPEATYQQTTKVQVPADVQK